jgi:hypothetical protein
MQNYILYQITMQPSKKYPRPAKLKKSIHRTELISDFTLNSDNYDIEVSYVVSKNI